MLDTADSTWVNGDKAPTNVRRPIIEFMQSIQKLDQQLQMLVCFELKTRIKMLSSWMIAPKKNEHPTDTPGNPMFRVNRIVLWRKCGLIQLRNMLIPHSNSNAMQLWDASWINASDHG
jgi:hypothetical protein